MFNSNHPVDVLPRFVEDTYTYYLALSNTVWSSMWEFNETVWAGSYTSQILQLHALELKKIRQTAADYRMFVLEV